MRPHIIAALLPFLFAIGFDLFQRSLKRGGIPSFAVPS
jgi:hypothetical protein